MDVLAPPPLFDGRGAGIEPHFMVPVQPHDHIVYVKWILIMLSLAYMIGLAW